MLSTRGSNNYKLKKHGVGEPLRGTYSDFLDTYKIRDYEEMFHAPICESDSEFKGSEHRFNFKHINNINVPEILDHKDVSKEEEMLKIEEEYEKNSIKDPYYSYVSPQYIGNTLTYSDKTIETFLDTHRGMDANRIKPDL